MNEREPELEQDAAGGAKEEFETQAGWKAGKEKVDRALQAQEEAVEKGYELLDRQPAEEASGEDDGALQTETAPREGPAGQSQGRGSGG